MKAEARQEGVFRSGDPEDERTFEVIQILPVEHIFDRSRKMMGANLPGYIKSDSVRAAILAGERTQRSNFNEMMELGSE